MSASPKSVFASLPRTSRGVPIVINGDPKGKNFLYTNGNSVFIRDLRNPSECDIYTQHTHPTVCAQYSPSGFYIASGDVVGKVRIWDTVNKEHILKNEFTPFSGIIKDICYAPDNTKIVVGGEGKDKYIHTFNADTGTSVGDMGGVAKSVNSVSYKPTRPFRIAAGSEDFTVVFYQGPPFKFDSTSDIHTNFVNVVRYSPNGNVFVSAGADGKLFVFDGKTAEMIGGIGEPAAHKGGVYALSFSKDGSRLMSASADKTVKVWDMESKECVATFVMGTDLNDMQVGCLWQDDILLSISLSGHINYLDLEAPGSPKSVIKGHNKPISSMVVVGDKVFTGAQDGQICCWDVNTGANDMVTGKRHTNQVSSMSHSDGVIATCGMDDTVRFVDVASQSFNETSVKMPSQPQSLVSSSLGYTVVATGGAMVVVQGGGVVSTLSVDYLPFCVTISPDQSTVAVGGKRDKSIHIYTMSAGTLTESKVIPMEQEVITVQFSPDGTHLAAAGTNRAITVYETGNYEKMKGTASWVQHSAKVNCLSWSPDSQMIATGSMDCCVIVWSMNKKTTYIKIDRAHQQSPVTDIGWADNNTVVSVGLDCNVRQWAITPP